MNKKAYILILLALVLLPIVTATIGEGIDDALKAIFNATGDTAYIKAGIWLILFFIIFKSAERIFPTSRGTAVVIALVISMLGSRFMPDEYLEYVGGWYAVLLGVIILLFPFFIGSIMGDILRFERWRPYLIILFYGGLLYIFAKWQDVCLRLLMIPSACSAIARLNDNPLLLILIILGLMCLVYLKRNRGLSGSGPVAGPSGVSPSGGGGPSFWQGLGRGAGASARWANVRYRWLRRRMYQQRAAAEQAKKRQPLPPSRQIGWFRGGIR